MMTVSTRRKRGQQLSFQSRAEMSLFDVSSKRERTQWAEEQRSYDGPGFPTPRPEPGPFPDTRRTAFTPNTGNAGASVKISLTGTNLTGASLSTTNPGILVRNVVTTPTTITATFQIAFSAADGLIMPRTSASVDRLPFFFPCRSVTAVSVGIITSSVKGF